MNYTEKLMERCKQMTKTDAGLAHVSFDLDWSVVGQLESVCKRRPHLNRGDVLRMVVNLGIKEFEAWEKENGR